ncbi:MAG: chromosome partitioning protein ParB [Anaerolinea sp.]|nr:chromosome partitioning protein ParB [Anaerolinea sp.]
MVVVFGHERNRLPANRLPTLRGDRVVTDLRALPLDAIDPDPDQPRRHFDRAALAELADSIASLGVVEPLVVRPVGDRFVLIAGERRWRAARMAGLSEVPVVVRGDLEGTDAFMVALVENVLRHDLNPVEEADGYQRLLDTGMTIEELAARIGKSESAIRARLRLHRLAPQLRDLVASGQLDAWSAGHISRLSHEGQFRVMRAMSAGDLRYQNDLDRLTGHLALQEQQGAMFGEDEVESLSVERMRSARDLLAELDRAAQALSRVAELLPTGVHAGNAELVGAKAEALKGMVSRVASEAHFHRAHHMARQLTVA